MKCLYILKKELISRKRIPIPQLTTIAAALWYQNRHKTVVTPRTLTAVAKGAVAAAKITATPVQTTATAATTITITMTSAAVPPPSAAAVKATGTS